MITKCCLLEDRVEHQAGLVVVPWGASMAQIREGLRLALGPWVTAARARPAAAPCRGPGSPR